MLPAVRRGVVALLLVSVTLQAGCRSGGVPFINLLGLDKPVVMAIVLEERSDESVNPLRILNPAEPYEPLRVAMGEKINRPVAIDLALPIQIVPGLRDRFYHLAMLSPYQYAKLPERDALTVLAISNETADGQEPAALLVVKKDATIDAVENLRGKTVAFGPEGASLTDIAAQQLLAEHGLTLQDLKLQLLPIPGAPLRYADTRALLAAVDAGRADAGFVDERWWNTLPPTTQAGEELSQNDFRVLATTPRYPAYVVARSPKLSDDELRQLKAFFADVGRDKPTTLRPLRVGGFQLATGDELSRCQRLAIPPADIAKEANTPAESSEPAADDATAEPQ